MILASLGQRGRRSIWTATLLLAAVHYHAAISQHPNPQISEWCAELEKQWGISLNELVDVEFRRVWCASVVGGIGSEQPPESAASGFGPGATGFQQIVMSQSHITLPSLQSFGLLHAGGDGMLPLSPPFNQLQSSSSEVRAMPLPDRRVGIPRGMPWLEEELKGQTDAAKGK